MCVRVCACVRQSESEKERGERKKMFPLRLCQHLSMRKKVKKQEANKQEKCLLRCCESLRERKCVMHIGYEDSTYKVCACACGQM